MSVTLQAFTLRCAVETSSFEIPFRATTGSTLKIPSHCDVRLEVLFTREDEVAVVSNFVACALNVYASARTGSTLLSATQTAFTECTLAEWEAQTGRHCVFTFDSATIASSLPGSVSGTDYFVLLVVTNVAGKVLAEAWTKLTVYVDNYENAL